MLILGVDLETTGLSKTENAITEIGMILWDTEFDTPVEFCNLLVDPQQEISKEIIELTGITPEIISKYSVTAISALEKVSALVKKADYLLAHNAPFDRGFLEMFFTYQGIVFPDKPWIDSSVDVEFPASMQTRKLTYLAAEHGFVNPFPHRAVTDVLTMLQICRKYPWEKTIESAKQPTITIRAMVQYAEKENAKAAGYRWNADNRTWVKDIKEHKIDDESAKAKSLGFEIRRVQ